MTTKPPQPDDDMALWTTHPTHHNTAVSRAFAARQFIHGGGVAIFHIKSARVVVVHHTREDHWFLPKGRKDVDESSVEGAEREGFEESGYRNRVLPLPHPTVQTWDAIRKDQPGTSARFHTEPIATDIFPMGRREPLIQYICSWYIAETLPPDLQTPLDQPNTSNTPNNSDAPVTETPRNNVYQRPPPSHRDQTLRQRMEMEPEGWEPERVERSTTQSDELFYRAELLGIEVAKERLRGTGLDYIVEEGWKAIQLRLEMEKRWREQAEAEAVQRTRVGVEGKI